MRILRRLPEAFSSYDAPKRPIVAWRGQGSMTETERKTVFADRGATLPPPPPGVRYVRVPWWKIVIADDDVRRWVDDVFHWPMIILALAILPLFLIEFLKPPTGWLQWAVDIGFAIIWLAFLVEFVIKVSIAESRFQYCRRNWIDIVIILLPALRVFRIARLARTTRLFRLRGVGMKFGRHVFTLLLGMETTERMLERFGVRPHDERKDPRQMTRYELMDEVKKRRREADAWEAWYAAIDEHLAVVGAGPLPAPPEPPGTPARPAEAAAAGTPDEDDGGEADASSEDVEEMRPSSVSAGADSAADPA
jgi:hypothetical protein